MQQTSSFTKNQDDIYFVYTHYLIWINIQGMNCALFKLLKLDMDVLAKVEHNKHRKVLILTPKGLHFHVLK